jgi:hypothetical protein
MTNGSSAGFKRPGLKCVKCGVPFALTLAVQPMESVKKLPDPFRAKCPSLICQHEATYPKSAIQTLVSVGRQ